MSQLPETAYCLHPAEDLLYSLALLLADPITLMPRGSSVNSAVFLLRYVRRGVERTGIRYETFGVIAFIGSDGYPIVARNRLDHHRRCIPLGCAIGLHRFHIRDQSVSIVHQYVAGVTQLCFLARALARQQRLRVGRGLMRRVAPLLAMKVHRRITGIIHGPVLTAVLILETLQTRAGLQQCSVYCKVLIRHKIQSAS